MNVHVYIFEFIKNEFGKKIKKGIAKHLIGFPTSLINSIIQEHECKILFII